MSFGKFRHMSNIDALQLTKNGAHANRDIAKGELIVVEQAVFATSRIEYTNTEDDGINQAIIQSYFGNSTGARDSHNAEFSNTPALPLALFADELIKNKAQLDQPLPAWIARRRRDLGSNVTKSQWDRLQHSTRAKLRPHSTRDNLRSRTRRVMQYLRTFASHCCEQKTALGDTTFGYGLYKTCVFLRHDCDANAVRHFVENSVLHLYATRPIAKGEEVSISVLQPVYETAIGVSAPSPPKCSCPTCVRRRAKGTHGLEEEDLIKTLPLANEKTTMRAIQFYDRCFAKRPSNGDFLKTRTEFMVLLDPVVSALEVFGRRPRVIALIAHTVIGIAERTFLFDTAHSNHAIRLMRRLFALLNRYAELVPPESRWCGVLSTFNAWATIVAGGESWLRIRAHALSAGVANEKDRALREQALTSGKELQRTATDFMASYARAYGVSTEDSAAALTESLGTTGMTSFYTRYLCGFVEQEDVFSGTLVAL